MNVMYQVGDRVIIELNGAQTFEGDFLKKTKDRVDIENVICYETQNKLNCVLSFYKKEIKSILVLKAEKQPDNQEHQLNEECNSVRLNRDEYDRLKLVSANYVYIKNIDNTYYDSVREIANFESVGVYGIGSEKGRSGKITLLALSTWKQVYVFDLKMYRIKGFLPEVKEILESGYITKIVHGGGTLKDCLQHSHDVYLTNIFDTQVADLTLIKNQIGSCPKKLRNISQCLTSYFNFPSVLLESSLASLNDCWQDRPLEDDLKLKLSRLVTYLVTLRDHLLNLMLKDFHEAVDNFHDLFTESSQYEMSKRSATLECTREIEAIIPDVLMKKMDVK